MDDVMPGLSMPVMLIKMSSFTSASGQGLYIKLMHAFDFVGATHHDMPDRLALVGRVALAVAWVKLSDVNKYFFFMGV